MIHFIHSDLTTFKNLDLHEGFNLLLCEKTQESTEKQTRNRAGKSSLIEIVHFLLGANVKADSIFRSPTLESVKFSMRFDLGSSPLTVVRSGGDSKTVYFVDGDFSDWPVKPKVRVSRSEEQGSDAQTEFDGALSSISNTEWCRVLGQMMFGIDCNDEETKKTYTPTFRSLFSYFARRSGAGGFLAPQTQSKDQQLYDWQAALLFLLDLDWKLSSEWKAVRDREKSLVELKRAAKSGALGTVIPKSSVLQTEVVKVEEQVSRLRAAVQEFRIVDGYRDFEKEASTLTSEINELSDDNALDEQLIKEHTKALEEEAPAEVSNLETLYKEVGIIFPDEVKKRLVDARQFHESIIANRRSYLQSEIDQALSRIAARDEKIERADTRRQELFSLLKEGGALEQHARLSEEAGRAESRRVLAEERYQAAKRLESESLELEGVRQSLLLRLRRHFDERQARIRHIIRLFEEVSQSLHEGSAGSLTIDPDANGPKIGFQIQGKRSTGINNIQIFCFDLVLARLCAERGIGPRFLIHDSHIFDGVDTRQVRGAMEKAVAWSQEFDFQYLLTLNSDALPSQFSVDFPMEELLLPVALTDDTETGGLFGVRFE